MTNIRRYFQPNEIVFITHVTYKRMPVLVENSGMLHRALEIIENRSGAEIIACVILPDHFHYNPVKHGYVGKPCDWVLSSFGRYSDEGYYTGDWGVVEIAGDYGE